MNRKYDVADIPMLHRHLQCQLVSLLQVQHLKKNVFNPPCPLYTLGLYNTLSYNAAAVHIILGVSIAGHCLERMRHVQDCFSQPRVIPVNV